MRRLGFALLFSIVCWSFVAAGINVSLNDVGLEDFIKFVSVRTGKNIVYSRSDIPAGIKINIHTVSPITESDLLRIFFSILEANNLTVVEKGKFFVVLRSNKVKRISTESTRLGASLISRLFVLRNVSALEVSRVVKGVMSASGRLDVLKSINAIVVTDVENRIERISRIVKLIDSQNRFVFKSYSFGEVDSADVLRELRSFFRELSRRNPGIAMPVFFNNEYSNSIIVAAKPDIIPYISEVIDSIVANLKNLNVQRIFYLKHAVAKDMYSVITSLISKDKTLRGVSISYNEATNSLIVIGKQAALSRVEALVKKLDIPRKQVFIEALFIETSLSKLREFGVEWSSFVKAHGGVGYVGTVTSGTLNQVESAISSGSFAPLPGGFVLGVLGDTITYNGIKFPTLGALINALKSESGIDIVSNPRIVTMDNQKATIFVGENRPYLISEKYDINGNPIYSYTYKDVGVKMNIWPHISGNKILLRVSLEVNKVSETVSRGKTVAPVTLTRKMETEIALKDGEKILISGLVERDRSNVEKGVPVLSSIPVLGNLFKYNSRSNVKTSLAIFLSVRLVNTPEDVKSNFMKDVGSGEKG